MMDINDTEFTLLKNYLTELSGIDIPSNKRYLFKTRLTQFLTQNGFVGFSDLYNRLTTSKNIELQKKFIQSMTTHESSFFRDKHPFRLLQEGLLNKMIEERIQSARYLEPRLNILSAGCSNGQEPYSIAMILRHWLDSQTRIADSQITLVGADISQVALARARQASYTDLEVGKFVSPEFRHKYFKRVKGKLEVTDDIKKLVRFTELNLSESFIHIGKFDIIFCRNVIIYFPIELKKKILESFHRILNPEGVLFMGASESLYNLSDKFKNVTECGSTYYVPIKN